MNKRILLVEDEVDIASLVEILLEREGYEVISYNNAENYQTKVAESKADLVILDLNIAGFNGQIVCEYLRQHPDLKDVPVILMSANINILEVKNECGANDIIKKPFDIATLVNTVRKYT